MTLAAILLLAFLPQEFDTVVTEHNRRTAAIIDEIQDPAERKAFLELYKEKNALARRTQAAAFLKNYPASWLSAQAHEAAAQAAFEMGDAPTGLFQARQSLAIYPENAMLLTTVAAVLANRGEAKQAREMASRAAMLLDQFLPPAGVPTADWQQIEARLQKTITQVLGSAQEARHRAAPQPASAYAGTEACRSCHAAQYEAWRQTGMARMLRPLKAANMLAPFKGEQFEENGHSRARMTSQNGQFFIDLAKEDNTWQRYRIDMTIGSKWQQAYATKLPNGALHVLPVQFSKLENRWLNYWRTIDPAGSERAESTQFHRQRDVTSYQQNCAPCHTSRATETSYAEPGVNCEMCHGPSARHASAKTPALKFASLTPRESVAVCAQCHAQSAIRKPQAFPPDYRRRPYTEFSRRAFYKDGRFRETTFIVEAFERSACFLKGGATCASCHNPHPGDASHNPVSLKFQNNPDQMCLGCHNARYSQTAHVRHETTTEAARCVSCHMPKIANALLFRARSHQIDDKPNATALARFGPGESPNACLICHKEKTTEWTRAQLQSWPSPR